MGATLYWVLGIAIFISIGRQFYMSKMSVSIFIREVIITTFILWLLASIIRWFFH